MSDNIRYYKSIYTADTSQAIAAKASIAEADAKALVSTQSLTRAMMEQNRILELGLNPTRTLAAAHDLLDGKYREADPLLKAQMYRRAELIEKMEKEAATAKATAQATVAAEKEKAAATAQASAAQKAAQDEVARNTAKTARIQEAEAAKVARVQEAEAASAARVQEREQARVAEQARRLTVATTRFYEEQAIKQQELAEATAAKQIKAAEAAEAAQIKAAERVRASAISSGPGRAKSIGGTMSMAVTLPYVVGMGAIAETAAGYERSQAVFQAANDVTAAGMEKVRAKAIELGRDFNLPATSAKTATESMLALTKAGMSVDDSIGSVRSSMLLSAAAGISQTEAATITAKTLNSYSEDASHAAEVTDYLTNASLKAGVSVGELAAGMSQAGSMFAQNKYPMDELITDIALLTHHMMTGEEAGTSLKQMLIKLEAPSTKAKEVLSDLKVSLFDANGAVKPLNVFVGELGTALNGATDKQRDFALATVFGARAVRSANILLQEGSAGYDKMKASIDETGTAQRIAGAQMTGLLGAQARLKTALTDFSTEVGPRYLGFETAAVNKGAEWIRGLGQLDGAWTDTLVTIGGVASVIGPTIYLIGSAAVQVKNWQVMTALANSTALQTPAAAAPAATSIAEVGTTSTTSATEVGTFTESVAGANLAMEATPAAAGPAEASIAGFGGAAVTTETAVTGMGTAARGAALGGLATMSLVLFDILAVTKELSDYGDLFKDWSPGENAHSWHKGISAPGMRSATDFLTSHPEMVQQTPDETAPSQLNYGYMPDTHNWFKAVSEPVDFTPEDWSKVSAVIRAHPNWNALQIDDSLGISQSQIREAANAKKMRNSGLNPESETDWAYDRGEAAARGGSGYKSTTPVVAGSYGYKSSFDALDGTMNGGGKSAAAKLIEGLADGIKTPPGQASCANFASELLGPNGLGKHIPPTASAKGLADYVESHGGRRESAIAAKPGDLIVWTGSGFGAMNPMTGHRSGYHVGVAEGNGLVTYSNDGITKKGVSIAAVTASGGKGAGVYGLHIGSDLTPDAQLRMEEHTKALATVTDLLTKGRINASEATARLRLEEQKLQAIDSGIPLKDITAADAIQEKYTKALDAARVTAQSLRQTNAEIAAYEHRTGKIGWEGPIDAPGHTAELKKEAAAIAKQNKEVAAAVDRSAKSMEHAWDSFYTELDATVKKYAAMKAEGNKFFGDLKSEYGTAKASTPLMEAQNSQAAAAKKMSDYLSTHSEYKVAAGDALSILKNAYDKPGADKAADLLKNLKEEEVQLRANAAAYGDEEKAVRAALKAELDRPGVTEAMRSQVLAEDEVVEKLKKQKALRDELKAGVMNIFTSVRDAAMNPPKQGDTSAWQHDKTSLLQSKADLDKRYAAGLQNPETAAAFKHDSGMIQDQLNEVDKHLKKGAGSIFKTMTDALVKSTEKMLTDIAKKAGDKLFEKAASATIDKLFGHSGLPGTGSGKKTGTGLGTAADKIFGVGGAQSVQTMTVQNLVVAGGAGIPGIGGMPGGSALSSSGGGIGGIIGGIISGLGHGGGGHSGGSSNPVDNGFVGFADGGYPDMNRPFVVHKDEMLLNHPGGNPIQVLNAHQTHAMLGGGAAGHTTIIHEGDKNEFHLDGQAMSQVLDQNAEGIAVRRIKRRAGVRAAQGWR
jgi:TP901 family phage tail tape measure protein